MLFVDVQPSEQLAFLPDQVYCLVAVMCLDKAGFPGLLQYKCTHAVDRPAIAKDLATYLGTKNDIRGVGFVARESSIRRYSNEVLSQIPHTAVPMHNKQYKTGKGKVNFKVGDVLPWYSACLNLIGLKAATWAKWLKQSKITILVDRLPGSPEAAMEMTRLLSHRPELDPLWKRTKEAYEVEFEIANLLDYGATGDDPKSADEHPCMILADRIAHSVFAANNDAGYQLNKVG